MDHVLDYMKKHGLPLTRAKYLEMAFLGRNEELDPLDAEEESMLPREFQKHPPEYVDPENED
jgi:hypothetical protein